MKLNENLKLDFQAINDQHEAMLDKLNVLDKVFAAHEDGETIQRAIFDLAELTEAHFDFEEALMRHYLYPGLKDHQQDHKEILVQLGKIQQHALEESTEHDVMELLRDYFERHMQELDRDYADFILRSKPPVGPV